MVMMLEQHKIQETRNPKLRLSEVQWARGETPVITFEAFLTKELVEWLKSDGGIEAKYIERLERLLDDSQPI